MKNLRKLLAPLSIVLLSVIGFTSCKDDAPTVTPPKDVTAVAIADPQFSTLVAALTKANLVTTLQGTGPFTVFAPNNAAFTKAGITTLDNQTAASLTPILTSHVLSGTVKAADVKSGTAQTVNAANPIYLSKNSDGVFINGNIKVIATDVTASNGVIHVIDNVIVPPTRNIVEEALNGPDKALFTDLVELVGVAGLGTTLSTATAKGYTVFAPTNDAFKALYAGPGTSKAALIAPANRALLTRVLLYHVVGERVFSTDLPNVGTGEVPTAGVTANPNDKLTFDLAGGAKVKGKSSGNSTIIKANVMTTNGVIHAIDKVLLP
ncbi:MAG: hypothetical protein RLZZ306_613 [Bacteroidota bacterium]|jgi:uncharacterized surface protein with fasciclin (FAS1) repeats